MPTNVEVQSKIQSNALPFVTVVMPIRNEGSFIERSLGAVLAQEYPPDRFEVIVADGLSTDGTRELVQSLAGKSSLIRIVDNPGKIVPTGLNAAIRKARGEVILRVDGHTVIAGDYIRQCVAALERSGAENVGGRMDAKSDGNIGAAVAVATSSRFGVGGARFHYSDKEEFVDTVYMGAWPRRVFDSIGLFDEEQVRNQDDEFNYRLLAHGGKILLSPRIKSVYYNRTSFRRLASQYFQYGFWKVRVMQKHPGQMRLRQFVPPVFVAICLLSLVLSLIFKPIGFVFAAATGTYLVVNVVTSLALAAKQGMRLLPLLPIIFATLHFSYGSGFLLGLLRFCSRWSDRGQPLRVEYDALCRD